MRRLSAGLTALAVPVGLGLLPTSASAAGPALHRVSIDASGYLSAWTWLAGASPDAVRLDAGQLTTTTALSDDAVVFSPDLRARGTTAFWRRGGVAVAVLEAPAAGRYTVAIGLPAGSRVLVDGEPRWASERDEAIPDAADVPIDLTDGPHLVTVVLAPSPSPSRLDGDGFFLRLLDANAAAPVPARWSLPAPADLHRRRAPDVFAAATLRLGPDGPSWHVHAWHGPNLLSALGPTTPISLRADGRTLGHVGLEHLPFADATLLLPAPPGRPPRALTIDAATPTGPAHVGGWTHAPGAEAVTADDLRTAHELQRLASAPPPTWSRAAAPTLAYHAQHLDDLLSRDRTHPALDLADWRRTTRALLTAARKGDPLASLTGLHVRAYRSPLDGRLQPYAVLLPHRPDARPLPLIVGLHGHRGAPERMCQAILGGLSPAQWARQTDPPTALLCPFGYGDTAFRFAGEDDLFRALHALTADAPIDPDRIFLAGLSDGGLAAFEVALHHPDRFAAVAVMAAVGDMRAFPAIGPDGHTPDEDRWLRRVSAIDRAANGGPLPWLIVYGGKDRLPTSHVTAMADALRAAGARVELRIHDDLAHDVWTRTFEGGALARWFAPWRRDPAPPAFTWQAFSPRYRAAWDLTLETADFAHGARVHVERSPDATRITTTAVHSFSLTTPTTPLVVDGEALAPPPTSISTRLILSRDGERWRAAPDPRLGPPLPWPAPSGLRGHHGEDGPLDEIRSARTLYVYGTGWAPDTALLRYTAELDRARNARGVLLDDLVLPDTALTDALMTGSHLVLYGDRRSNRAIADLLGRRALTPDHTVETGLRRTLPHPRQPGARLVLVTGPTGRSVAWTAFLPEILGDEAEATRTSVRPPFGMVRAGSR